MENNKPYESVRSEYDFLITLGDASSSTGDHFGTLTTNVSEDLVNSDLKTDTNIEEKEYFLLEKIEKMTILEHKYELLQSQLQNQSAELVAAGKEIERLRNQVLDQSTFCASLGAVLGNLAWRASRFTNVVDVWLSGLQNKVSEFLSIADGSLAAFAKTYETTIPPSMNAEYQFILGVLGIVTNISSVSEGREFIISNPDGKNLVRKIVKLIPTLPIEASTHSFMRLMLMILYNVSMNNTGLSCLYEFHVAHVLGHCLNKEALSEELQLLCLHILQSISYDLKEPKYIQELTASVSIKKIKNIAATGKRETRSVADDVVKYMQKSLMLMQAN